jgi:hypothetical protein
MFQVVAPEDTYKVQRKLDEAAVIVMGVKEPHITVTITLTSPIMREQLLTTLEGSGGKETKKSHRQCRYHRDSEPGAHCNVVQLEGWLAYICIWLSCAAQIVFFKKFEVFSPIQRLKLAVLL